jgi:hypothetical protein
MTVAGWIALASPFIFFSLFVVKDFYDVRKYDEDQKRRRNIKKVTRRFIAKEKRLGWHTISIRPFNKDEVMTDRNADITMDGEPILGLTNIEFSMGVGQMATVRLDLLASVDIDGKASTRDKTGL